MQLLSHTQTQFVTGAHSSRLGGSGLFTTTFFFILDAPHIIIHWKELINYIANLYENGCEAVDPQDKVGQWLVCKA